MAAGTTRARWALLSSLAMALRAAMRPGAPALGERAAAVPRMVRAALAGHYQQLGKGRLLGMLAAVLYIASPIDLVPEGLLTVIGLADDAMVVAWLAGALINDTEEFLAWERGVGRGPQDAPAAGYAAPGPFPGPGRPAPDTVQSYVVR